jgi:hypothetical protein
MFEYLDDTKADSMITVDVSAIADFPDIDFHGVAR